MSVVVGVDAAPLLGSRTGVGAFVEGLLSSVTGRAGVRLRTFGLTGSGWRQLRRQLPAGVAPPRRPMPAGAAIALWSRTDHPTVEWWTGSVDVVHGTNFVTPPSRKAAGLVSVHDLTSLHHPELCQPAARRYPELVRRAVRAGAWVHAQSEVVAAETVEHLGARPDRVRVIPPGVALDLAPARPPPPGPPYVLALGTVEPRKNLPRLVAAFDRLAGSRPELRLRIAGPDGWGEDALREAVAQARHGDRVDRLGWVEDRGSLLAGAAVFAYPSLDEGFGVPPLEAMALGVPVVAGDAGGIPEVVADAGLLVAPEDVDGLAQALEVVLDDGALRDRLVAAGHRRVGFYRWDRFGEAMAGLYRELGASR